jgi:hypothetical protein
MTEEERIAQSYMTACDGHYSVERSELSVKYSEGMFHVQSFTEGKVIELTFDEALAIKAIFDVMSGDITLKTTS